MKKIFYILDDNGEFLSEDGKKRYKALTGQALYQFLRTEEGKKKFFDVWQDDDRAVMVGVEVPLERTKIYAAEQRRRRYIKDVMQALDISHTSLDIITDMETNDINGEQILSLGVSIEEDLIEKIEREELHSAIAKLSAKEKELIQALFFDGYTERQWSALTGIPQKTINDRKHKILEKIKKFLKN